MTTIRLETTIDAPPEVCFDLSRSIDLHLASQRAANEIAIGGTTSGLIGLGETVTWRATHFGIRFTMTVRITCLRHGEYFTDEMVSGPFAWMVHKHVFKKTGNSTVMTDEFDYGVPLGFAGVLVDWLIVKKHLTKLLKTRNAIIKASAEECK